MLSTELSNARFHAKLETLRDVLQPVAATHGKEMLEKIADDINAAFDKLYLHKPEGSTEPTRANMIEYVQQAIKDGYSSYYNLPEHGIGWLTDECLKVEHGVAWEFYNLGGDENAARQKSFVEAATPLIKWMAENVNPHHTAVVDSTSAELLSSEMAVKTEAHLKD
ncbi:hypothetical protein [Serratia fonticola]